MKLTYKRPDHNWLPLGEFVGAKYQIHDLQHQHMLQQPQEGTILSISNFHLPGE
jgi:hypothetical protein